MNLSSSDTLAWTAEDTAIFTSRGWFMDPSNSLSGVKVKDDWAKGLISISLQQVVFIGG